MNRAKKAPQRLKIQPQFLPSDLEDPRFKQPKSIVRFLPLYFPWDLQYAKLAGCPYTALSILTGEDPFKLRKTYGNKAGLSPLLMTNHLVQLGFEVVEINKTYLYNLLKIGKMMTDAHVILASLRMSSEESSWVVIHGGIMWHNYVATPTSFTTSLSFPMEYAYKVYTPTWESCGLAKIDPKELTNSLSDIEEN